MIYKAPTGIAASLVRRHVFLTLQIGGQTLHSFASFPISVESLDENGIKTLLDRIKGSSARKRAYTRTDVLVIDEASMIHPDVFDLLNRFMKELRDPEKRHLPFGGLQVIVCGDFFQLPPVVKQRRSEGDLKGFRQSESFRKRKGLYGSLSLPHSQSYDMSAETPYLFDSEAWADLKRGGMKNVELSNVFRQSDPEFLGILDELRQGHCQQSTWKFLNSHRHKSWPQDGILVYVLKRFNLTSKADTNFCI